MFFGFWRRFWDGGKAAAVVPDPRDPRFDTHDGVLVEEDWRRYYHRAGNAKLKPVHAYAVATVGPMRASGGASASFLGRIGRAIAGRGMVATVRPIRATGGASISVLVQAPAEVNVAPIRVRGVRNPTDEELAVAAAAYLEELERDARRERARDLRMADELEEAARELRRNARERRLVKHPWSDT